MPCAAGSGAAPEAAPDARRAAAACGDARALGAAAGKGLAESVKARPDPGGCVCGEPHADAALAAAASALGAAGMRELSVLTQVKVKARCLRLRVELKAELATLGRRA